MAKSNGGGEDAGNCKAVFVDTNLDTHLAIPVSSVDTIYDLKAKIMREHSKCFPNLGDIEVHDLKVKRKGKHYSLSDLMPVTSVFSGTAKDWFLFADISNQLSRCQTADHNKEFLTNPHGRTLLMLTDPSLASQFQRVYERHEGNLLTDNLSEEARSDNARSENLQLVACFKSDENLKSSSSDTDRLNALVENIYNASCEKGKNSSVLVTEVTSVNSASKSLDVGSLQKNKRKKKRKIAACAQSLKGSHTGEIESAYKDSVDVTIGSDNEKRSTKKNYKRVTKLEEMNDKDCTDIDAPVNVSGKSVAALVDVQFKGSEAYQSTCPDKAIVSDLGTVEKVGVKNLSMHVQGNNEAGTLINRDHGTKELGMLESLPDARGCEKEAATCGTGLESGMKKSKKRKHKGDDVSLQMDIETSDELGVPDIGDLVKETKVPAEFGMTRPSKRTKTGDDGIIKMDHVVDKKSSMLDSKQQIQTQKSKKKIKQKQTSAVKSISEFAMRHQCGDTMELEKSSTMLTPAAEEDNNFESVSSPSKQMEQVLPLVTSEADIEVSVCLNAIKNVESDVKPQQGAHETIHSDAKPIHLTQIKKTVDSAKIMNKRSSKKAKPNQNDNMKHDNVSENSVKDQNDNMKHDSRKSTFPELTAENNDEILSSCQEQIDRGGSVTDSIADVEMSNAKGGVDAKVFVTNHENNIRPPKEADDTMQYDAETKQLTHISKQEKENGIKNEKSKKKIKKKTHILKSISEVSVEDQNNSIKLERRQLPQSDAGKDNTFSSSSPVEQINNVSSISVSQADDGLITKPQVDEVIITDHGSDVNLQQMADDTCQNVVQPTQLPGVKGGKFDTESRSVRTKKKTKQQQTRAGKSLHKAEGDQYDRRNDISLDKDVESAPVEVCLNAPKNEGSEKTSSGSKHLPKSTNMAQPERTTDLSTAKRPNPTDPINLKVVGRSADAEKHDRFISSAEQHTAANITKKKDSGSLLNNIASAHVETRNDSRASGSHLDIMNKSDILNKKLRQGKSTKELPKMKQNQSSLHKSSDKSTKKAVQNPSKKKSLISKCSSIFKDESSSSSEDEVGGDASNSSTEIPHDDHVSSSDYSEDESRGSWASPKQGNSENGGSVSNSKSMEKNLTLHSILRSSRKYKKAKLLASQMQMEDDESQAVDIVPDSQANT